MVGKEIWKPIPGYKEYKVSNHGKIKRIGGADARGNQRRGKSLKPQKNKGGYLYVLLCENGKPKYMSVHKAVMSAFVGECPSGLEINHIDENKENNSLSNLEYITHKKNVNHGTALKRGSEKRCVMVTQLSMDGEVMVTYKSIKEAAEKTGLDKSNICKACKDKVGLVGGYVWKYGRG